MRSDSYSRLRRNTVRSLIGEDDCQFGLAHELNMSGSYLSLLLQGRRPVTDAVKAKLLEHPRVQERGLTAEDLWFEDDQPCRR